MKKSGIYKITSPSNRIYIGQSSDLKERFRRYKHLHRSKLLTKLYRSFLKYGIENHKFEIIEECLPELLNERERYWQDYYNVNSKNGLTCGLLFSTILLKHLSLCIGIWSAVGQPLGMLS